MLMGDLLEEFFKRPYVAAKVAEGKLPDTWREIVGDRGAEITTELKIGGYPLRKYGSQGQQKSFLIALKLAQYAVVAQTKGERPILLLDDLFDKLDAGRVEQLIRLVSDDTFGQILITDCNPTRLKRILDKAGGDYTLFSVAEGAVTQERAAAEDPAEGPAGNAAENAANTPENAAENTTEDSAKGAEKERSVPESTDEQP